MKFSCVIGLLSRTVCTSADPSLSPQNSLSCAKGHPFTHRTSAEPFSVRGMAVITHETTHEEDFVSNNDDSAHGMEGSDGSVRDRAFFTHRVYFPDLG